MTETEFEPSLEELLSDPITCALMDSDDVKAEDVITLLREALSTE